MYFSMASETKILPDDGTAELPLSPSLPNDNGIINERQVFRDEVERHRAKQLEFLEQQLSAFADFANDRKKLFGRRKGLPERKDQKKGSDKIWEDASECVAFDKSPSFIKGTMRDYQLDGLKWLISLHRNGLNGILADEMGLGKTIQSISMIGYLMNVRYIKGPFLVIAPLTTLDNWMNEFAKFLPSAKVFKAHARGDDKQAVFDKLKAVRRSWDVAVTSYEFVVRYAIYFSRINFHYAVIDEGHRAKNEHTLFAKVLRRCNIQAAVMLTGTPIHNNLHELWALLNMLMPLFFNNADNFDSWFKVEDCIDPQHEQTLRLQNILKPLMLRRIKSEVCPDIPSKVRITLAFPPTEETCVWTQKLLNRDVHVMKPDGTYRQFTICNVFPFLRQAVLHPFLIPGCEPTDWGNNVTEGIVDYSSKMIVLDGLLKRIQQRGSKVLIFSQFVKMLQILLDFFDYREYGYCVVTGDTSGEDRQKQINEFNRPGSEKFIFALSTRAGGLGINLVAADTIIFYDMDYNPQMDFQAEDRAHRIGQLKKVHIFRLIVRGTVEESLNVISERKKLLDEAVIRRSCLTRKLANEAIEYQQKTLSTVGTIDRTAVDASLDAVFREMDTGPGLVKDRVITMSGNEHHATHITPVVQHPKRTRNEELTGPSKRPRHQ